TMAGVKIKTQAAVKKIIRQDHGFTLVFRNDETLECDRVLLATGSSAVGHQIAKELGHTLEQSVPSLFTFNIRDPRLTDLPGVSVPMAKLKLNGPELGTKLEQSGPLLVTHWGLSGPAVLKLSAWGARLLHQVNYQAQLNINWLPNTNPETLKDSLIKVKSQLARKTVAAQCPVMLPRRLWESLTIAAGISPEMRWSDLSKPMLNLLLQELLSGTYQITGKGVFKEEFVTCGGVNLKEVDFKTMESRICPGLYFAGEVLDIDGVTGGFNFQSAWSTGWIAGSELVSELTK
ncbi:MAG: aminoacetone oxidase family FAD-binding enzyme, partial [Alkalinema sp. CAN_BIN05]|nr:aminoacetone oxidase family FAD-binding enzyme [Alkalinema sp. CAN_BIN05]